MPKDNFISVYHFNRLTFIEDIREFYKKSGGEVLTKEIINEYYDKMIRDAEDPRTRGGK